MIRTLSNAELAARLNAAPRVLPPSEHIVMETVSGWAHGRDVLVISNWVHGVQTVREVRL